MNPDESLAKLRQDVADMLDKIVVRTANAFSVSRQLEARALEWEARGGGAEGAELLRRAQGVAGFVSATPIDGPTWHRALNQLIGLKQELRALAAATPPTP